MVVGPGRGGDRKRHGGLKGFGICLSPVGFPGVPRHGKGAFKPPPCSFPAALPYVHLGPLSSLLPCIQPMWTRGRRVQGHSTGSLTLGYNGKPLIWSLEALPASHGP